MFVIIVLEEINLYWIYFLKDQAKKSDWFLRIVLGKENRKKEKHLLYIKIQKEVLKYIFLGL